MTQFQKTRKGRTREERDFDLTQLHEDNHGQMVHRDYAAHFFRWVTVKEACRNGDEVLDIGCGQDLPLIKILHGGIANVPKRYVGVDLNKIDSKWANIKWATVHSEFNFIERWQELEGKFTKITCFEVIEHMHPPSAVLLLKGAKELLADGGSIFLSTPVFNGAAAVNHVFEFSIEVLQNTIELADLHVEGRWGTFGNVRDLEPVLTPEEKILWDRWKPRLGNDGLSVVFSTDHPDQSRNNLWLLKK